MKLSWDSIKISIAGARLSHLVQKDKVWDYGSMIEQVKTVFMQMQKARNCGDAETIKKYMTLMGYHEFKKQIQLTGVRDNHDKYMNTQLIEVGIVDVHSQKKSRPDSFKALLKEKQALTEANTRFDATTTKQKRKPFEEYWLFVRQGDWWVLDEMK